MRRAARFGWWTAGLACAFTLLVVLLIGRPAANPGAPAAEASPPAASPSAPEAPASPESSSDPVSPAADKPEAEANEPETAPEAPVWATGLAVLPPVPVGATADYGTGVSASVESVTPVEAVGGRIRGETSGPGVVITVRVHNDSDAPVDLDSVVVDLYAGDGQVGAAITGDPHSSPASGPLAPGAATTATYVRLLPDPTSEQVSITVSYAGQIPSAVFEGSVPR